MTPRTNSRWSWSTGEKGTNRVRVFTHPKSGRLFLEWSERSDAGCRGPKTRALGHEDRALAKQEAEKFSAELRANDGRRVAGPLTLRTLSETYEREVTPGKARSTQQFEHRTLRLFLQFWGPTRAAQTLTQRDWDAYLNARRSGRLHHPGHKGPVRDRVIEQDLRLLRTTLNWAVRSEMLLHVPMSKCILPKETSPKRPILFEEEYVAMLEVAPRICDGCHLAIVLVHETGHRVNAIRLLRWSDVDFAAGMIRWRAEHDKLGREHFTPLSERAREVLVSYRGIGEAWLFRSPVLSAEPLGREVFGDWWREAEVLAKVPRIHGRGWHSLRRKFATERKSAPLRDLAEIGGWKSTATLLACYIRADEVTMRRVLAERTPLMHTAG